MTTSFPPLVTPNPGIHNPPSVPQPTPQSALGVINQATGISTGVAGQVSTALTGVGGTGNPFASLAAFGQAALGAIGNIAELLINLGVDAIEGVTDIIKDAIQGIANIFDAIFSAFTGGIFGGGASQDQALGAMTATADTIATHSAEIQKLQGADAADSNNGVNVFVDFTTTADGALTGFTQSGTATISVSGGRAVMGSGTGWAICGAQPTSTDYQLVSAICQTAPSMSGAYLVLIGRSNASLTTLTYALIDWFQVQIHNVVSGVDTVVATLLNSPETFYAGAIYSFECGQEGSVNTYTVLANGSAVLSWVDTASVTNIGALYRFCGFGMSQFGGTAPKVATFGFTDNTPGALIGDMFRAYSTATTPIAIPNATVPNMAPGGYYDTTELASSNYTYDPTTNTLTVSKAGIYIVEVSTQWVPNTADTFTYFGAAVFKNGVLYKQGNTPCCPNPGAEPFFSVASETFTVQMNANDFLQPGWYSYSTPTGDKSQIAGDPAAELTIFSCALMNTGTAAT